MLPADIIFAMFFQGKREPGHQKVAPEGSGGTLAASWNPQIVMGGIGNAAGSRERLHRVPQWVSMPSRDGQTEPLETISEFPGPLRASFCGDFLTLELHLVHCGAWVP